MSVMAIFRQLSSGVQNVIAAGKRHFTMGGKSSYPQAIRLR
jgi:hypothetical protein